MPETRSGAFCQASCEHESKVRSSHSYARQQVFERDGGVCELCELDTEEIVRKLANLIKDEGPMRYWEERRDQDIPDHRRTLWDMDHILPVVEGGGQCGLEGYRTLCIWCHIEITADLNSKLAKRKLGAAPT